MTGAFAREPLQAVLDRRGDLVADSLERLAVVVAAGESLGFDRAVEVQVGVLRAGQRRGAPPEAEGRAPSWESGTIG